jgi:CRP-like cAMP-binding protein
MMLQTVVPHGLERRLDPKTGTKVLRAHGWLSFTPADFQDAVLSAAVWRSYEIGESLIVAGDPPGGMFGFAQGSVAAFTVFGAPDSPMVHLGGPGVWTGEGSLVTGQPRRISAVARSPTYVAYVPLPALREMLAAHPDRWRYIALLVQFTVDMVVNGLADLMIRDSSRRCAAMILRLGGGRFVDAPTHNEIPITQEDFALMANLSRSTVNPILRKLTRAGLIEAQFGVIRIKNAEELRRIADGD